MSLNFPSNPTNGQTYTSNGRTWVFDSTSGVWNSVGGGGGGSLDIPALPLATLPLAGTEPVPIVQGGETRRAPAFALNGLANRASGTFFTAVAMSSFSRTPIANRMILIPYQPERPIQIQRFQIRTHTTAGVSNFALAIYDSGPNGLPVGAPIFGGAAFDPTYNFVYVGYNLSLTLPARRLWLAFVASASAGSFTEINAGSDYEYNRQLLMQVGDPNNALLALWGNSVSTMPFIDGVTPGVWPTLTGQFSDFTGRQASQASPTFSFQVA